MTLRQTEPGRRKILLALDSSSSSPGLLRAAVQLAVQFEASVEGLLIEDINLLRLIGRTLGGGRSAPPATSPGPPPGLISEPAALHFVRQVSRQSSHREVVDAARIDRELRIQARRIEQMLTEIAARARVDCTFRTIRGVIDREIRIAAAGADLLALWGARRALSRQVEDSRQPGLERLLSSQAAAGEVLIISCQSASVPESLLFELIRERGRRTILVTS
jgi:hypothetical protein